MPAPRVTRFDHAVIAVDDLDAGVRDYRGLGFDVTYGGAHTGRGTHNAIIRFGLDYLELIAVHDRSLAEAAGGNVPDLIEYVDRTGGGLLGFALAAVDLDGFASAWSFTSAPSGAPVAMERLRPDGMLLSWRLLIPGGSAWRKPWPFLIEWKTPDDVRLKRDRGGSHANGAVGVASVTVIATDPARMAPLYERDLRLPGGAASDDVAVTYSVGGFSIRVVKPRPGAVDDAFTRDGEGLCEVDVTVADLEEAGRVLGLSPDSSGRIAIPSDTARGARIVLTAGS